MLDVKQTKKEGEIDIDLSIFVYLKNEKICPKILFNIHHSCIQIHFLITNLFFIHSINLHTCILTLVFPKKCQIFELFMMVCFIHRKIKNI